MWAPDPAGGRSWAHDEGAAPRQANTDRGVAMRRRTTRPFSSELVAVAERHWLNPAAHPAHGGPARLGVGPLGLDRPAGQGSDRGGLERQAGSATRRVRNPAARRRSAWHREPPFLLGWSRRTGRGLQRGAAGPARVWLALAGRCSMHDGAAEAQASRAGLRAAGAQLRQRPHLRRGRLHDPALALQPCPLLFTPSRLGPGPGDWPSPPRAGVAGAAGPGRRYSCGLRVLDQ